MRVAKAYKNHRPGSNKGAVHRVWDRTGSRRQAMREGERRLISPSSVVTWISEWRSEARRKTKRVKTVAAPKRRVKR